MVLDLIELFAGGIPTIVGDDHTNPEIMRCENLKLETTAVNNL